MGHFFRILGLNQETFVRNLEPIPGLDKSCYDDIAVELPKMSLKKACRSATVVHARILILASEARAQFSARWDEWILLTLREQEGVSFSYL